RRGDVDERHVVEDRVALLEPEDPDDRDLPHFDPRVLAHGGEQQGVAWSHLDVAVPLEDRRDFGADETSLLARREHASAEDFDVVREHPRIVSWSMPKA